MGSEDVAPAYRTAPTEVHLLITRPDRVVGELPVQVHHCDAMGRASVATLFDIADTLGKAGILARYGTLDGAVTHEAKTIALRPGRTNLLTAAALPLPAPEGLCSWQTTILDENGETVAIIAQGYLLGAMGAPEPKPVGPVVQMASNRLGQSAMPPVDSRIAALVAAGTEVIARKGFSNATIREIAEQAGVHIPTFYQHIASKDDLLEMVYANEMKHLEDELDLELQGDSTARERLDRMIASALDTSHRRKRQIGILNREMKSLRPDARARVVAQYRRLIGCYEAVIREGIRRGEFKDIDPVVIANLIDMVSDMWALRPFFFADHSLEAYRAAVSAFIFAGLCADGQGGAG